MESAAAREFLRECGEVELIELGSTGSTNSELKELARRGAREYTAALAWEQTSGRGSRGRSFYSPAGTGVYFSLLLRPGFKASEAAGLITPASAVAAARAIEEVSGRSARVKRVNDVLVNGRKVCGVLTEAEQGGPERLAWVVVGVGINVSDPEHGWPADIAERAGSVYGGQAPEHAAARLAAVTVRELIGCYRQMPERAAEFMEEYERRCARSR